MLRRLSFAVSATASWAPAPARRRRCGANLVRRGRLCPKVSQPPRSLASVAPRLPSGPSDTPRVGLTQRRPTEARRRAAVKSLQRFVREEAWNGLAAGDVVRVAGHPARGRHWRFRAHVTNTSNGVSWVEVALIEGPPPARRPGKTIVPGAGPGGDGLPGSMARVEKVRSVDPGLVTPRFPPRRMAPAPAPAPSPSHGVGSAGSRSPECDSPDNSEPGTARAPGRRVDVAVESPQQHSFF